MKRLEKKKTSHRVLVLLGTGMLVFILVMIVTFWVKGSVPDTLIQYTLGAGGVEAVALSAIRIAKVISGEAKNGD